MIIDPRYHELADGLTGFSTSLKKGERVLIDAFDVPDAIVIALIRAVRARGAQPMVQLHRARVTRELTRGAEAGVYEPLAEVELARMQSVHAYIALRGSENIFETSERVVRGRQTEAQALAALDAQVDAKLEKRRWLLARR